MFVFHLRFLPTLAVWNLAITRKFLTYVPNVDDFRRYQFTRLTCSRLAIIHSFVNFFQIELQNTFI